MTLIRNKAPYKMQTRVARVSVHEAVQITTLEAESVQLVHGDMAAATTAVWGWFRVCVSASRGGQSKRGKPGVKNTRCK